MGHAFLSFVGMLGVPEAHEALGAMAFFVRQHVFGVHDHLLLPVPPLPFAANEGAKKRFPKHGRHGELIDDVPK
jgi:hypothetical protein